MELIYARYNKYHNSIDITTFNGYLLRMKFGNDFGEPSQALMMGLRGFF